MGHHAVPRAIQRIIDGVAEPAMVVMDVIPTSDDEDHTIPDEIFKGDGFKRMCKLVQEGFNGITQSDNRWIRHHDVPPLNTGKEVHRFIR
jgi:hypothetical protein